MANGNEPPRRGNPPPQAERVQREPPRRNVADLETPDDLHRLVPGANLTVEQASMIFDRRKNVGSMADYLQDPASPLTAEQVNALRQAGFIAIPKAITAEQPRLVAESKKKESALSGALKAIIKPISWQDKSKVGYGVGVAAGILSKGSWFVVGPTLELGLGAGTYLANFAYDRIAKYRVGSAKNAEERIKREERWKRAGGLIRGVAAGYSAASLANMAGAAVAPGLMAKLHASEPFVQAAQFAGQKWASFEAMAKGGDLAGNPIQDLWVRSFDATSNAIQGANIEITTTGDSILNAAGQVVEKAGVMIGELGAKVSASPVVTRTHW